MAKEVLVAIITVTGGVIVAAISYYLTKRQQREVEWRDSKLNHYKVLLSAISDLAIDNKNIDAHNRFALAVNTIGLVAPQEVVDAMLSLIDWVSASNKVFSKEHHDKLLTNLLLAIRKDIGIRPKDNASSFHFHLAGAPSKTING